MKKYFFALLLLVPLTFICIYSCKKPEPPELTQRSTLDLPATPFSYDSDPNGKVATVGRVLFYDTHLSVNNSVACGSCHKQSLAFSDNIAFSTGFENRLTKRNTPPIQNLAAALKSELFWDGRESFLKSMVMKPILNHIEMGIYTEKSLADKINSLTYYADLFKKAFGTTVADDDKIAESLSRFTSSIRSHDSKFETMDLAGGEPSTLNELEKKGEALFMETYHCKSCHNLSDSRGYSTPIDTSTTTLTTNSKASEAFVNIGLDLNYGDNGVGDLNKMPEDNGKFKIPNLRNVALTAPYMHDGRFATLDQVLNHYSQNIKPHVNLDPRLKDISGKPKNFNIPKQDKEAIIAFLNTLTDFVLISDPKFSNPFVSK